MRGVKSAFRDRPAEPQLSSNGAFAVRRRPILRLHTASLCARVRNIEWLDRICATDSRGADILLPNVCNFTTIMQ